MTLYTHCPAADSHDLSHQAHNSLQCDHAFTSVPLQKSSFRIQKAKLVIDVWKYPCNGHLGSFLIPAGISITADQLHIYVANIAAYMHKYEEFDSAPQPLQVRWTAKHQYLLAPIQKEG